MVMWWHDSIMRSCCALTLVRLAHDRLALLGVSVLVERLAEHLQPPYINVQKINNKILLHTTGTS